MMRWHPFGFSPLHARSRGLCALVLVAFVLVACRFPEREITVVKIGLVAPFEGSFRDIGYDAIYAARLAVREINRSQGADSWRLELIAYDDRGNPEMAAQAARNLVADPGVLAVVGHYRADTTQAAAPIYAAAGLPFITLGGWGAPAVTNWHLMPAPDTLLSAMLHFGRGDMDVSPVVWGTPLSNGLSGFSAEAPDRADAVEREVPLVLSLLPPIPAGERLSQWREEGWVGQVVGDLNFAASAFATLAGPDVIGAAFVTPYPFPGDIPDTSGWIIDYEAMGPHVSAPGVYALPTYEAVYLVAEALNARAGGQARRGRQADVPASTREELARAVGQVTRTGWLGPISWDEQHTWDEPPLYVYRWTEEGPEHVETLGPRGESQP